MKQTISGPYVRENLTVFLIHGVDTWPGDPYVSLDEALNGQKVVVHETGNVGELAVENLLTDKDVFIQAGDMVRGGRQDRTFAYDYVVPARSGKMPIPAFCVEMGRWSRRAAESPQWFSSSTHYLSSSKLRMAAKLKHSQGEVWNEIAAHQQKLSGTLKAMVADGSSPSSLELTMEHAKVKERRQVFMDALAGLATEKPDAVGFAFAINGNLISAEVYGSSSLFRKLWLKMLEAAVTEALAESGEKTGGTTPTAEHVRAFFAASETGAVEEKQLTDRVRMSTRRSQDGVLFETHDNATPIPWIHRNYIKPDPEPAAG